MMTDQLVGRGHKWVFAKKAVAEAFIVSLIALGLFFLFLAIFTVNRILIGSSIVFYDGLAWLFAVSVFFGVVWCACFFLGPASNKFLSPFLWRLPQALVVFFLIGYSFVITIPSLLDRSISLYLLSSIVAAGKQGATPGQLDDWFYRGFVVRNGAVEKRLNEQRATGNVVLENGRYTATARGEITYTIYQNFVDLFNTDPRYVVPINEEAVLDASSSKSLEQ